MSSKPKQSIEEVQHLVGKQVYKPSGKPFKSGEKVNTVTGVVEHPYTDHLAFTFEEDDSAVECFRVKKFIE